MHRSPSMAAERSKQTIYFVLGDYALAAGVSLPVDSHAAFQIGVSVSQHVPRLINPPRGTAWTPRGRMTLAELPT